MTLMMMLSGRRVNQRSIIITGRKEKDSEKKKDSKSLLFDEVSEKIEMSASCVLLLIPSSHESGIRKSGADVLLHLAAGKERKSRHFWPNYASLFFSFCSL